MSTPTRRDVIRFGGGLTLAVLVGGCTSDNRRSATAVVPEPLGMVRTSWSTDPWALGSYSYLPVGATPAARRALAEPLDDRVFFAGEATASAAPATVHGALESGDRVAAEIAAAATVGETVAIIGAGAAGLRAGAILHQAGHSVIVFEARGAVGGRLATVRPDGWPIPVELGASWVHDVTASDLAQQLRALGVAATPFDYDRAATLPGRGATAETLDDAWSDLEMALADAEEETADQSIRDAYGAAGHRLDASFELLDEVELAGEYGANADELSAWWGTAEGSEGDDLLVLGGYGRLAEHLADGLDVRLGTAVTTVRWGAGPVQLELADGATVGADRCIVTVPLGVLADGRPGFDPPLPGAKDAAVRTLGVGLLDKVWLRFDEPFWRTDALMWTRVGQPGEAFRTWFNLAPLTSEPVLLAVHGGRTARAVAALGDTEVRSAALDALAQFAAAGW